MTADQLPRVGYDFHRVPADGSWALGGIATSCFVVRTSVALSDRVRDRFDYITREGDVLHGDDWYTQNGAARCYFPSEAEALAAHDAYLSRQTDCEDY